MIVIDNTIVSDDLYMVNFVCKLSQCKGACCVEGDAGAPIEEEEISQIEDYLDEIKPFMTDRGKRTIEKTGVFDYDTNGDFVTPLVDGIECAFTNFIDGVAFCSIEKAYREGKINFQKPVSCHLYPIRITRYKNYYAVNFHKWIICKKALKNGNSIGVPLYKFCREALIRKYGKKWYYQMEKEIQAIGR